jgi:beta-mannosidase
MNHGRDESKIIKFSLNGEWEFAAVPDGNRKTGIVPGSVLTDLLRLKEIGDPFWRLNEGKTKELLRSDYKYERSFDLPYDPTEFSQVELVCRGLDTLAEVEVNGKKILGADDMHRTWRTDVKKILTQGENRISVLFRSPVRFAEEQERNGDIFYSSTGSMKGNQAIRKAHYMFGWDWGPQLPDMGIFRDIGLELTGSGRIGDVLVTQEHWEGSAELHVKVESLLCGVGEAVVQCSVTAPDGTEWSRTARSRGEDPCEFLFSIEHPQLWWPNGLGDHPLYRVEVSLTDGNETLDERSCSVGLRTITVSTRPDEWGSEFAFVVNGVKLFAMGANYIPQDNLIPRVSPAAVERLVADCAEANFNCLRVWGGGYYPDDCFYDACDRHGILVWQDLMFACNVYDLNDSFENNIICETRDNVRRIRHHACLGLWCGNNEMEWGWADWDRLKGHRPKYKADYVKIFEMILPRTVKKYDPQTYYWFSSPSSGGSLDDPNSFDRGDCHYWEVWHSNKPFTEYRKHYFRFCSEYGFQSFPCMKTIESFSEEEDRNIFSEVMESHQKNGLANSKIFSYISGYFKYPRDLDSIAYISQILQLKAIQYGVEHWRRNRGRCMGSIYWQLNDCWPVASWASIDYFGRWKALHYGAKRFYRPFMASACEKEELSPEIRYYVHNDSLVPHSGTLTVRLTDARLNVLFEDSVQVSADPLSVKPVYSADFSRFLKTDEDRKSVFACYELKSDGETVGSGTTLFVKPKHFRYPKPKIECSIEERDDRFEIDVRSDTFANYVEVSFRDIDCVFSDNYFDLTSRDAKRITVKKSAMSDPDAGLRSLKDGIAFRSVADSY